MNEYYLTNRETIRRQQKEYSNTQKGRAIKLLYAYNQSDKQHNRGKGDLTAQWIIENIFNKPCVYCGETDYHKLGCNRIDNAKPHTMDNVEPCCMKCNRSLPRKQY